MVVTDSRNAAKRGKSVDIIGSFNPKMSVFQIDGEKAKKWIANGTQVSDTLHNLLVSNKIIEGKKKNVLPRKSPIIDEAKVKAEAEAKEKAEAEAKAAAEAAKETPAEEAPVEVATEEVKEEVTA